MHTPYEAPYHTYIDADGTSWACRTAVPRFDRTAAQRYWEQVCHDEGDAPDVAAERVIAIVDDLHAAHEYAAVDDPEYVYRHLRRAGARAWDGRYPGPDYDDTRQAAWSVGAVWWRLLTTRPKH